MNNSLKVIVPVYNAEKYIEKCLESIFIQKYKNYTIIMIDDCSTDLTYSKALKFKEEKNFHIIKNETRSGSALSNIVMAINLYTNDDDIVVLVDGDDWLFDDDVFSKLNLIYQDSNTWMTYGQFIPASNSYGKFCKKILDVKKYRKSTDWFASHLRTFRKKLWNKIDDKDLRHIDQKYYDVAWDCAIMYPILEMCGDDRYYFIDDILYVYNDLNEINDMKINKDKQLLIASLIKEKEEYKEIESL